MLRARSLAAVLLVWSAAASGVVWASGAPSLVVVEMAVKGVKDPLPYTTATNRRGPMLATCFGTKEAMRTSDPFEVFIEVAADGTVQLVSLGRANKANAPEVDACLLSQLDKARFPESDRLVKLRMTLGPAPERQGD